MKKIIFDIDNTLMMFDKNYLKIYESILKNNNMSYEKSDAELLLNSICNYEYSKFIFTRDNLLEFLKLNFNPQCTLKFVDNILDVVGETWCNPVSKDTIDVLEYLSSKYELYILTNWFTKTQSKRLENVGILKYFKEVIGGDIVMPKPSKESFESVIKGTNPKDCIMIGDNIDIDIKGAINSGMDAILFDYKDIYINSKYKRITKLKDLKEIL